MKIYYGWVLVGISALVFALVVGSSLQAIGLFVIPVSKTFGLTRAQFNLTAILLNVGTAFAGPLVGRTLDLHSIRRAMFVCAALFGGSLIALGFLTDVRLSAIVIFVCLSVAVVGTGTLTAPTLLSRWFTVHRGRAMAIATAGIPLGSIIVVPLIAHAIAALGWRHALVATGVIVGAVLGMMAFFVRDAPNAGEAETGALSPSASTELSSAAAIGDPPIPLGTLLSMPRFWTISVASALAFGMVSSDILAIVPFAQGLGYSETQASSIMSIFGIGSLTGTLLFGWFGDRVSPFLVLASMCVVLAGANAGLSLATALPGLEVNAVAFGIASGAITPAYLALIATAFGPSSFGVASGCASVVSTMASAIAIRFGGDVFDRTGSYRLMLLAFAGVGLIATGLIIFARRFVAKPAVRR